MDEEASQQAETPDRRRLSLRARWASSRQLRRGTLIAYWVAMFGLTHVPEIDRFLPSSGWRVPHFDKMVHFVMYAGWSSLWWLVLTEGGRSRPRASAVGWIVAGGVAWAAFDELTQAIVGRHPSLWDFLCDVLGVGLALAVLATWQRRRSSKHLGSV